MLARRKIAGAVKQKEELCTTATLLRGRTYVFTPAKKAADGTALPSMQFFKGQPVKIDDPEIAAELEELVEEVTDTDEEILEKPIFSVEDGQPIPPPAIDPSAEQNRPRATVRRRVGPVSSLRRVSREDDDEEEAGPSRRSSGLRPRPRA
jgi:hypothetical protein